MSASESSPPNHCGNWPSKITSQLIVRDSISIDELCNCQQSLYYIERRPSEKGRCVLVKFDNGKHIDLTPEPYSVRTRVHEYGGGSYCVTPDNIFFVNDSDQNIYCLQGETITTLTNASNLRFADFCFDTKAHRLIAICEQHGDHNITNTLVAIDFPSGKITTLKSGYDFYASPRIDLDCRQLCWQSWNHPDMPWDANELWLADIDNDGQLINSQCIAGGKNISTFQPRWSTDNQLYYIADNDGWWHLHCHHSGKQLTSGEKEFGLPQWVFAQSTYDFIDCETIICQYQEKGHTHIATLSLTSTELTPLITGCNDFHSICSTANYTWFVGASSTAFPALVQASFNDSRDTLDETVLRTTSSIDLGSEYFSVARPVSFLNRHQQTVYASYYAPANPAYPPGDELPPLIVICHGGPTGQSSTSLDPRKQFWTSRGFAILDVNYSGSTGYGRAYRSRLKGLWGILDVEDCCDAALFAVEQGMADKDKLIIRGSSAGGFTVLCALTFHNVFSTGASYYGISELESLANDTHKFEARYLDRLVGDYPEDKELYQQRSPINFTNQLNCPVIFFQGMEDRVVPLEQAVKMVDALSHKGVEVAAQYYETEQHGFRQASTIMQSLENELSFYQLVLGLKAEEEISFQGQVELHNTET